MKKKLFFLSLIAGLALGMFALSLCGDDEVVPTPQKKETPEEKKDEKKEDEKEEPAFDPVNTPLTLEAVEDGSIRFSNRAAGDVYYSVDGGAAQTIAANSSKTIEVKAGEKVAFYGDNAAYYTSAGSSEIFCSADAYAYGNIMSLVSSTDYADATTLTEKRAFAYLFRNNRHLKNNPSKLLLLPATTLTDYCYTEMFYQCEGLTLAPALPATTLAYSCYDSMFAGCTALTQAPALPATTLASACYMNMFTGCTALTKAPELPATTMKSSCYSGMFRNCTALTQAPALPARNLDEQCYENMFQGCTKLLRAPALSALTLADDCYFGMFQDCTKLKKR